jgi:DNA-binding transcriptional MerR regulator
MENYTVQQAAALTGLSEHTLRYYERIGLIQPVARQESSGHRRYGAADLAKLESLACLRATGMPIEQMRRYFELRAGGGGEEDGSGFRRSSRSALSGCGPPPPPPPMLRSYRGSSRRTCKSYTGAWPRSGRT